MVLETSDHARRRSSNEVPLRPAYSGSRKNADSAEVGGILPIPMCAKWPASISEKESDVILSAPMARLKILALLLSVLAVCCVCVTGWTTFTPVVKLKLLVAEYFLLLPATIVFLRHGKRTAASSGVVIPVWIPVALYLCFTLPLAGWLGSAIYQSDESAYLFQASSLSAGNLWLPAPPERVWFSNHIIHDGRWFGKYPFGWPALLSIGQMLHFPWVLNPLLGLGIAFLTYRTGARLFSAAEAATGTLILVLSPFFWLNCIGYMAHPLCSLLIVFATWSLVTAGEPAGGPRFRLAGMCLAIAAAALIRPYTAACAAFVLFAAAMWRLRGHRRLLLELLAAAVVTAAAVLAVTLAFNRMLTGDPRVSPYSLYRHNQGVAEISLRPVDIVQGLVHIMPERLADTAATGFPLLFVLAAVGIWFERRSPAVWLLLALFLVLVLGHVVQIDNSDSPIGERYYFETYFAAALLAGRGWKCLERQAQAVPARVIAGTLIVLSLLTSLVYARWQVTSRWPYRQIARAASEIAPRPRVVFLVESPGYKPENMNLNGLQDGTLYIPGPVRPSVVVHEGEWGVLSYDPHSQDAVWSHGHGVAPITR
jgi:hypothetical protein